jgi:hypothetical protein
MLRRQRDGARNKLDLGDRVQVRIVRKRLKVSEEQLSSLVRKAGNSIAAVRKEASSQRLLTLRRPRLPPAGTMANQEVATMEEQVVRL